jgi:hypothetical protein
MSREIKVTFDSVQRSGGKTTIQSRSLVQGLAESNSEMIAGLSSDLAPIAAADIRLDDRGRIVIDNPGFADALQNYPGGPDSYMTNVNCQGAANKKCTDSKNAACDGTTNAKCQ